jgi:hypothetical protein
LLIEESFDSHFFPADAVRFIPMKLCPMNCVILKADGGKSFALSPTASAVFSPQPPNFADRISNRERLSISDDSNDFKCHCRAYSNHTEKIQEGILKPHP